MGKFYRLIATHISSGKMRSLSRQSCASETVYTMHPELGDPKGVGMVWVMLLGNCASVLK